jgi:sterol desaturase/sphingolipid hydroxylase (fatty acid hydroxylase superfamily)
MLENFTPPPFITYAIPFFFLLMLVEAIVGYMKRETYFHFGDSIADLSTGILSQLAGIFLKTIGLLGYFWIYENFRIFELKPDSVLNWIVAILLWDFFYYWFHRLSHEINFFWASHVIHHHSEEYNLFVALRQTSLGGISSWIFYIPMAFIGIDPWLYLAAGQINLIYQYWVHTKSIKSLGTIGEFLLSTPSHHRVHHAINPKYIDKNHGGIFIIWDRIFKTFQKEEEPPVYGTVKPLNSYNPIYANYHYFWELLKTSFKANGFLNKIKVWFAKPGWFPPMDGKPAYQMSIPEVNPETFKKYRPNISKQLKRYNLVWFVLILIGSFIYLLFYLKLSLFEQFFYSLFIAFQILVINGNNEGKKWAWYLEIIRLFSLVLLVVYLPTVHVIPIVILGIISGFYYYLKIRDFNTHFVFVNNK